MVRWRSHSRTFGRFLALGMLALILPLVACACRSDGGDSTVNAPVAPPGTTVGPLPIPVNATSIDGVIGPEGGTLTHPTGARIVVPAGALQTATRLTLLGMAAPSNDALRGVALGQGFAAGPDGLSFLAPVDVFLPFDPTRIPAGGDAKNAQLRMAPHGSTAFVALQSDVDLSTRTIHARTLHFTDFAPALTVQGGALFVTTPSVLPGATASVAYRTPLAASGGAPPYTWALSTGSALPDGLAVDASGAIAGTATSAGSASFFVTVADTASNAVQAVFSLVVLPAAPPDNPVPVLTAIAPSTAAQGSAATAVVLSGSRFVASSQAYWDGGVLPTTFVSATELHATLPANAFAAAGTLSLSVVSPSPGGGTSAVLPLVVTPSTTNPLPTIASIAPSSLPVSNVATQIAIVGTGFVSSTSAMIGSLALATSFVSDTQLAAIVPASLLAAASTVQVGVYSPPPGGGTSTSTVTLAIGAPFPVPTLTSTSPSYVDAGSPTFTLSVVGTAFMPQGQLFFNATALATTVLSATSATAIVPASLVASLMPGASVIFANPQPGGGASNGVEFDVVGSCAVGVGRYVVPLTETYTILSWIPPDPGTTTTETKTGTATFTYDGRTISLVSNDIPVPTPDTQYPGFLHWVALGTSFNTLGCAASIYGGTNNRVEAYIDLTGQTVGISRTCGETHTNDPVCPSSVTQQSYCDVGRQLSGGGACWPLASPQPTLAQASPASFALGATPTLTLDGTGFTPFVQVLLDGASIPFTFVSTTQLIATLPSAYGAGPHTITVASPPPGGGSSSLPITVSLPARGFTAACAWRGMAPDEDGRYPVVDANGNLFVGIAGGGPSTPAYSGVYKLDAQCSLDWKLLSAGTGNLPLVLDASGDLVTAYGSGTFAGVAGPALVKLDTTGSVVWQKRLDAACSGYPIGMAVDGDDSVAVVCSVFQGASVTFGTVVSEALAVMKYDSAGTFLWGKLYGNGTASGNDPRVVFDGSGAVVVAGWFTGQLDFGGGALTNSGPNAASAFVAKLAGVDGAHAWSKAFVNASSGGVAVDSAGDILLSGAAYNPASGIPMDFGSGTLPSGGGYLAKIGGSNGAGVWSRAFGGGPVITDPSRNVFVLGGLGGTDYGGGPIYGAGVALAELDANGSYLRETYALARTIFALGLARAPSGDLVVTGGLFDQTDFGLGPMINPTPSNREAYAVRFHLVP
jgi:hypothetical protein